MNGLVTGSAVNSAEGKEQPNRKMPLAVRSLLCAPRWILVSVPAQLAAWRELQLFS